jgi:hypothetical protein
MDRWATALPNAPQQARRRARGEDVDVLRELSIDGASLAARLARIVASHAARLSTTVLCPSNLQLLDELQGLDAQYRAAHAADAASQELQGAVHKYKWARIVMILSRCDRASKEDAAILCKHASEVTDPLQLQDHVVFCSDSKTEAGAKLIFTVTDELKLVLGAILRTLARLNCTVCHETMPRWPEERRIAKNLGRLGVRRGGRGRGAASGSGGQS